MPTETNQPEMRLGEMTPFKEYRAAWNRLSPTQKARVMLKQKWEHRPGLAIFLDWPSLFDPNREQDEDELRACRELIAERPDLFLIEVD